MRPPTPAYAVPPAARARALGALVARGEHAVAFAAGAADSVLQGYALEGLESDERVVVLTSLHSPRALRARLHAGGVGAPRDRPDALRVADPLKLRIPLREHLRAEAAEARGAGYEGVRVAHLCGDAARERAAASEARFPRRFTEPLTLLCIYTPENTRGLAEDAAWALARHHGRILAL